MVKEPSLKSRLILYPLMVGLFLVGCYFIVLLAFGYNLKFVNGKLIKQKTGTILLSTRPGDASVTIDGQDYPKKTPMLPFFNLKIDRVPPGEHRLRVEKEGYETWEGVFKVESGMVAWGNYILFLPKEKKLSAYNFTNIKEIISARDQSKELITTYDKNASVLTFWEVNAGNKQTRKLLEKKISGDESFSPLQYSFDEERILFAHKKGAVTDYQVFEVRENGRFWKISDIYPNELESPAFNPRNHDEIYTLKNKGLISINYSTLKWERTEETNVLSLYTQENETLLVKNTNDNFGLWRIAQNGNSQRIISDLPVSEKYQIARLPEEDAYAVLPLKTKELSIYKSNLPKSGLKTVAKNVDWFLPSTRSKYLAYSTEGDIRTYEIHKNKDFTALDNIKPSRIAWAEDEANLIYVSDGSLKMINFNGFYNKEIAKAKDNKIIISDSYNVYFISENPDKKSDDLYVFSYGI